MTFQKKIFPIIFSLISTTILTPLAVSKFSFLLIPIFILAGIAFFTYFLAKSIQGVYVDEVYDCGDHLLVKNNGQQEKIFFSDISSIYATIMKPAGITLTLKQSSKFGAEIKFLPNTGLFSFSKIEKSIKERMGRI